MPTTRQLASRTRTVQFYFTRGFFLSKNQSCTNSQRFHSTYITMKLKLAVSRDPRHKDVVAAVSWTNSEELLSAADDHEMLRWNGTTGDVGTVSQLPDALYPTDMHWLMTAAVAKKAMQQNTDQFILTSTDGHYYIMTKSGKVEKKVQAHVGAVLSARCSYDGASILTAGEDGRVKVWSRAGLLRSTLVSCASPVYAARWSAANDQVLYCSGQQLHVRPLQASQKATQWRAHDGLVLCADWNAANAIIVSGGEDCRYKVWDAFGRLLYSSQLHLHPTTAVAWAPSGQLFAVGSYNTLRLCDKAGWSHCMEKPASGSLMQLAWCPDSTQVAAACANGHVLFGNIVDYRTEWRQYEAVQIKRRTVEIRNCANDSRETIEVKDRITKLMLAWEHLVVTTTTQFSKNWNTPIISDLKNASVSLIIMAEKHMLLVDGPLVNIINYDARLLSSIKFAGMRAEQLNESTAALSNDLVVIKDGNDHSRLHLFDPTNGKPTGDGKIAHSQPIVSVAVDQCGPASERRIAFVDKNNDLYLTSLNSVGIRQRVVKIGGMVSGLLFNTHTNMLVALEDNTALVYTFPTVAFVDSELLPRAVIRKDISDVGQSAGSLQSFVGNRITVRRADGSMVSVGCSPFPAALYDQTGAGKWQQALTLCRHVNDAVLWATLAGMATYAKNLATAEVAYGAIDQAEKVQFLSSISESQQSASRAVELALASGCVPDAERLLLQGGLVFKAIMLNIQLYKWNRALELAVKHAQHVDTVVGYKQHYLQQFGWKETDREFLRYLGEVQRIEVDWDHIQEKVASELASQT